MPNPNPLSPRFTFQWDWFVQMPPPILNVGCADDPLEFGDRAIHMDIDDWSWKHRTFLLGDAHDMPYIEDRHYGGVMLGDVLEHAYDPPKMILECARVADRYLVMTIFEEWELPGPGQWVKEGQKNSDEESRRLGYKDRFDYQAKVYPETIITDDVKTPHLIHINQFTDDDVLAWVRALLPLGWDVREYRKAFEARYDGHDWYNWLIAMERLS